MTLRNLYVMCNNCAPNRFFRVTFLGRTELLESLDAIKKYGDYEVLNFAIRGRITEVLLKGKRSEHYDFT